MLTPLRAPPSSNMSKPIDPAIAREKEKARLAKPNKGTIAHDETTNNKLDLRSDNINARLEVKSGLEFVRRHASRG